MHSEEKLMLILLGMAISSKSAKDAMNLSGTEYQRLIHALHIDEEFGMPAVEAAVMRDSRLMLAKFLSEVGVPGVDVTKKTFKPGAECIKRGNIAAKWRRAEKWARGAFSLLLVPKGDTHAKIAWAEKVGFKDTK